MSDCKCGPWGQQGECLKCGEHYTDQWGVMLATIERLEADLKNYHAMEQDIIRLERERDEQQATIERLEADLRYRTLQWDGVKDILASETVKVERLEAIEVAAQHIKTPLSIYSSGLTSGMIQAKTAADRIKQKARIKAFFTALQDKDDE